MGNVRSVAQALARSRARSASAISGEIVDIQTADRLVLPGQAMPDCMGA